MKLALVTTPPSRPSGIGDYVRHLLPHLRERCEVRVYVEGALAGEPLCGEPTLPLESLRPREHDQTLWQLGNSRDHGFMARWIRAAGGAVALHDWVLFDLAAAAFPALARGGLGGHLLALREGGIAQARVYAQTWRLRRAHRKTPFRPPGEEALAGLEGPLLAGWHGPEARGRWCADVALVRAPADARRVRVELAALHGGSARLSGSGEVLARGREVLEAPVRGGGLLALEVEAPRPASDARARGDSRRLGAFVRSIAFERACGATEEVDLAAPADLPLEEAHPSARRFELALNRSVVRFGDAFLVHSRHLAERIRAERNAPTPIALVHHGAQARWRDEDRRIERAALVAEAGLERAWSDAFLLSTFGALQRHKRLDVLLEALGRARRARPDLRLVVVGGEVEGGVGVGPLARRLRLEDAVHLAGHQPEARAWRWIHAADLGVQLRGPSTGGTSGGVFATLSMGRAVIASDLDEQRELPESCVLRVAPGPGEAERLAELLVALRDDPARRAAMEAGVRRFVEETCAWPLVARAYVEALEAMPTPRGARRSLLAMRMGAAVRRSRG